MTSTEQWANDCARVTSEMGKYVANFATPLTMSEEHGSGTAWGSGTYIAGETLTWILTAKHVVDTVPQGGRLAHLPWDGAEYNAAFGHPILTSSNIDAAALPIFPDLRFLPPNGRVLDRTSIAKCFSPVEDELLFWYGFPGYRVERNDPRLKDKLITSLGNHIVIRGKPMLSQAIKPNVKIDASNFDPAIHVAVHYPATATRATDGAQVALPNAAGMSGSALWDTKFIECKTANRPWDPQMAQICGVVWAVLDNPEVVFVSKIEHVRLGLPGVF